MTSGKDWSDSGRSDRPARAPSLIDLARYAAVALSGPNGDIDISGLALDRDQAIRDLQLTFRAQTLSDAVAQLYAGYLAADDMTNNELSAEQQDRCTTALRRMFLSVIPVVAEAAGISLAEIGARNIAHFAAREFPMEA